MTNLTHGLRPWFVAAAMVWTAILPASNAQGAAGPVELVEQTAGTVLKLLKENRAEYLEDVELLREAIRREMLPSIDLAYSARLILGKSGRGVSDAQLEEFANAMVTLLINRYAEGLLQFRSEDLMEILPLKGKNTDRLTRVRTRIRLESGSYAPVDYAFRKTDGGWKVFDVTVEGISYVLTFRNQIAPRVAKDGIDKVTADIAEGNIELDE